jgi:IS1 family transposase
MGDGWTYCAIDPETKSVPAFKCGKRTFATTTEFVQDVASRMRNRVQISTDAIRGYVEAIELSFGADVDYGRIVKVYTHDAAQHPERKYSAPSFASPYRRPIAGSPEISHICTSHVERLNATTRLHVKRLSRLTLAFSKILENLKAAVALHFAYYNFVRRHAMLRRTPAMAAGVERDFWTIADLVEATLGAISRNYRLPFGGCMVSNRTIYRPSCEETFQGRTLWEGIVEVFELKGHETPHRVYAWAQDTDNPEHPRRHVTLLHLHTAKSAEDAVRAPIVQEFKDQNAEA